MENKVSKLLAFTCEIENELDGTIDFLLPANSTHLTYSYKIINCMPCAHTAIYRNAVNQLENKIPWADCHIIFDVVGFNAKIKEFLVYSSTRDDNSVPLEYSAAVTIKIILNYYFLINHLLSFLDSYIYVYHLHSVLSYSLDPFTKMCLHMRTHCIDLK